MLCDKNRSARFVLTFLMAIGLILCLGQSLWAKDISGMLHVPDSGKTQILTLNDGSTLTGKITKVNVDSIAFTTQMGEMTISIDKIVEIKEVASSSFKGGKFWFPNPNQTRLYLSPTGRMLKKGQGYFSDLLLFFPSVSFGVTDNITLGGGVSLFPGVDIDKQLYYLIPKIGFNAGKNVAIAGSVLIMRIPGFDDDGFDTPKSMGIVFGTCTIGGEDNSFTFGVGHGYVGDEFAESPAVLVGGEYRIARRLSFVSENWKFPDVDNPLISYGLRFFGESISVDLALFNVLSEDFFFPGIPMVGFIWNF
ncbi:MAG: hypothetical protein NT002_03195 [candidate division Zixibacteria bacterium]|nr:hypothetical protein [candidate division Zixibacteria bacterium]